MHTLVRSTLALAAMTVGLPVGAANLVVNPGFETITSCPTGPGAIHLATGWSLPSNGSSDLYNSCATAASGVSAPANSFGSQAPNGGNGYAGFRIFSALTPGNPTANYREYVQGTFAAPLAAGVLYDVSYFVSLSDVIAIAAIANIDAYFSIGAVGPLGTDQPLALSPQFVNPGAPITDKIKWTKISGTYLASGGETHFVIGNFRTDTATNISALSGSFCCTYYYLDDVSVEARGGTTVPEPATLALLAAMAFAFFGVRKRKIGAIRA